MSATCRRHVADIFVSETASSQILLLILCDIVADISATCRRHVADNVAVVEQHYSLDKYLVNKWVFNFFFKVSIKHEFGSETKDIFLKFKGKDLKVFGSTTD